MKEYVVNKNVDKNGLHEVHEANCSHAPKSENALHIGVFSNCNNALLQARNIYSNVDGCKHCSLPCHKG